VENCPFCNPDKKLVLAETGFTTIMANLNPCMPIHILIIPKAHVETLEELNDVSTDDLLKCIKHVLRTIKSNKNFKELNILYNDGKEAGQSVAHVHIHIISRYDMYADNLMIGRRKEILRLVSLWEIIKEKFLKLIGKSNGRQPISDDNLLHLKMMFKI